MVSAIADKLGVVDERTEASRVALMKLSAHQFIQPLPGGDAAGGLANQDEPVGTLVSEVLVKRVGLIAVEVLDNPLVSLPVLLTGFFCGFKGDLRVLLDEHRQFSRQSIELAHLLDVRAHEANAFVERRQVLPVYSGPDVVG